MEIVRLYDIVGKFAENKDLAKKIRLEVLLPALASNRAVTFDFENMTGATQSFIHALISEAMRQYGDRVYDNVFYKNAIPEIRQIISIVYRYMQAS